MQLVAAAEVDPTVPYMPVAHAEPEHVEAPELVEYLPATQAVHVDDELAEYVPARQFAHPMAPDSTDTSADDDDDDHVPVKPVPQD